MIVLDTSYVSLFQYPENPAAKLLRERLDASSDRDVVTTAITPEEQMRGWLMRNSQSARCAPAGDVLRTPRRAVPVLRGLADSPVRRSRRR